MKIKYNLKNIEKVDKELKKLAESKVKIGILGNEVGENGTPVKEYAVYNEYGTSTIPARPFFRTALVFPKAQEEVGTYVKNSITEIINDKATADSTLKKIGLYAKGRVVKSISSGNWTPNAQKTIETKGKSKPLIDTGTMIRSFDFEVVKNG